MTTTESNLYEVGINILKQVGSIDYDTPLNSLQEIAPDLARLTVEFGYGEIMSRKELDLPTRQLCTVAALAAMANAQPQLKYHIAGALNVGCRPDPSLKQFCCVPFLQAFPQLKTAYLLQKRSFNIAGCHFTQKHTQLRETATNEVWLPLNKLVRVQASPWLRV